MPPSNPQTLRGGLLLTVAALLIAGSVAAAASVERDLRLMWVSAALGVLALLPLALLYAALRSTSRLGQAQQLDANAQRIENERNHTAILQLLDEISGLADGDLTVTATVTEHMTGAIADSVNVAVESTRGLIGTINQSAVHLDAAAQQTQALSQHLARASTAQSRQIAAATESIAAMAGSIEEVSGNAERAADVAQHSVQVAHTGAEAVHRTIDGMNNLRETIQDTAKRIKRLGESSQEIGNIVALINDIAEQTGILALNASIQASMAGEAGRGFAIVADEVQRLAERATQATGQIAALVNNIQVDTQGAVQSMERSTADVVSGAQLAEHAGGALGEIERVSTQIAALVHNISASARSQAQVGQSIARNMQVLREISAQTADSTQSTSLAIARMAGLSTDLRSSVAGFRLPRPGAESPATAPGQPPVTLDPEQTGRFRRPPGLDHD